MLYSKNKTETDLKESSMSQQWNNLNNLVYFPYYSVLSKYLYITYILSMTIK